MKKTVRPFCLLGFLLAAVACSPSLLGSTLLDDAVQEIKVDFYPGPAKVVVRGVPSATTVTPGILRLGKSFADMDVVKDTYWITFIKDGYESRPYGLTAERTAWGP